MISKKHSRPSRAFSLLEVSVAIIIIGIFVSGIIVADKMVSKFRRAAAKNLALASPVNNMKDTALWLETSLDKGFNPSEDEDGATVTAWYDQQNSGTPKTSVVAVNGGPTYANTINRVHAVEFGKNGSTGYLKFDASFLNNTDYTIMILEKRKAPGANLFLKSIDGSNADDNKLKLGYSNDNTVAHSQNNTSYTYDSQVVSYANSTDKPRLFTFIQSSTEGRKTYINGSLAAQDTSKTTQLSGLTSIAIGKGYIGEIGEIIIFTRALTKPEERQPVEDYASKKWTRANNRNSAPSCINSLNTGNYQVTDTGCDLSSAGCIIPAESGFASVIVSATSSPATSPCTADISNYSGNVTYTCINGSPTVTGHCTAAAGCSAQTIVGSTSQTTAIANAVSGSITCNASGYSGATVNYTCNNGILTPTPSCSCASGYTGATCNACSSAGFDTAQSCTACLSNYDLVSGSCVQKCTTPAATGITSGTLVPKTPVAQNCNASGYGGTFTYTCATAGGTATIATNSCVQQCTVSGLAGTLVTKVNLSTTSLACSDTANNFNGTTSTGSYSCTLVSGTPTFAVGTASCGCATGYTKVGSTCQQNCTIPNSTYGILDGTAVNAGTTSLTCNYNVSTTGTLSYTCVDGSFNITTNNCVIPKCSGGNTSLFTVSGETIHAFITPGSHSLVCSQATTAKVLVVGGGGAGGGGGTTGGEGHAAGGGGGGGGVVYNASFSLGVQSYPVVAGAGGALRAYNSTTNDQAGNPGSQSSFNSTIIAYGGSGGSGARASLYNNASATGASGGGGGAGNPATPNAGVTAGSQGYAGGSGLSYVSGGGGGAGGVGGNATTSTGGSGGNGLSNSITGASLDYGAGGGGAYLPGGSRTTTGTGGSSGLGGSGNPSCTFCCGLGGASFNGLVSPASCNQRYGLSAGNGGGGSQRGGNAAGGGGVVIVRYTN